MPVNLKVWQVQTCKCDKCGEIVDCRNCVVLLDLLEQGGAEMNLFGAFTASERTTIIQLCQQKRGRHLLAQANCEGSPSRTQYLPEQPKDGRGYGYNEQKEQTVRNAFAQMQSL